MWILVSILCISLFLPASGYKILVFSPTLSRSHMISNARVADTLARDGHDVTLLEVEFAVPLRHLNASRVAKTVHIDGQFFAMNMPDGRHFSQVIAEGAFSTPTTMETFNMAKHFQTELNAACERFIIGSQRHLDMLRAQKFDLIISEQLNFCGVGVGHLLRIPVNVLLSSCPIQEHVASLLGMPFPSSYVPSLFDSAATDKMSIVDRFRNLLRQLAANTYLWDGIDPLTRIFRKHFGKDFADLRDIVKNSPFVFVAVDEFVDFPRPTFPNVVYIGGLGTEAKKADDAEGLTKLPEPFDTEMTKGRKGVVYFSMGSIVRVSDLPKPFRQHLFEAFAQLPDYHFIVKVEKEDNFTAEIAAKMDNVVLTGWAPQAALLDHPRLRLFITHGGYNSLIESARAGVPLITMGFFADQHRNGRVVERNEWGAPFEKQLLLQGSAEFANSIRKVLEDQKYIANAKRTQRLLLTKPFTAEERLTKSIRFLELNGGRLPELLSESRNMSTMALYNLDLLLLAAVALSIVTTLFLLLIRMVWCRFCISSLHHFESMLNMLFRSGDGKRKAE